MIKETNVTTEYVKALTGKFDMETVFLINLNNKNISKINSIVKCKNLVLLNLSTNKLTSISGLENLTELTFLDLSFNNLTSMDGIDCLTKLRHLKLQGNKIDKPKNFNTRFKVLTKMEKLFFQSISQATETRNLICDIPNYRTEIFKLFVNLKSLDGIKKECDIFQSCETMDNKDVMNKLDINTFNFNFKESNIHI
jgi:hypothetical protein